MRDLLQLMQSYLGIYTERYCLENNLFISYDEKTQRPEYMTRKIISLHEDIIDTDLNFIFGENQQILVDNEYSDILEEILYENDWNSLKDLIVFQGLVLGTTGVRVGRDSQGKIRIGFVNLLKHDLERVLDDDGDTFGWYLRHKVDGKTIEEYFGKDKYWRRIDDVLVFETSNDYGIPWLFIIANKPSLNHDFLGIGEWEAYRQTVDEINSSLSRMAAIEDIYATPRFIVTGAASIQVKKEDRLWALPNEAGEIKILEYQGNILDSILRKVEMLENSLKQKAPELMLNDLGNISGYALRLKMQKLEKKILKLRNTYFRKFEEMFGLVYQMATGFDYNEIYYTSDLVIPANEEELMKKLTTLRAMGLVSTKTVLTELGYDFDEEQELLKDEDMFINPNSPITGW